MSAESIETAPSRVPPSESLFPRLWSHVGNQPRPVRRAIWWLIPAAGLSLILGAGAIIWDGVLFANPQTKWLAIAVGALLLYTPGLCFAGAILGLIRGWPFFVKAGIAAGILQGVAALFGFVSMWYTRNWAVTSVMAIVLWSTMDFVAAWRLWNARRWAGLSVQGRHGFDVAVDAETVE